MLNKHYISATQYYIYIIFIFKKHTTDSLRCVDIKLLVMTIVISRKWDRQGTGSWQSVCPAVWDFRN